MREWSSKKGAAERRGVPSVRGPRCRARRGLGGGPLTVVPQRFYRRIIAHFVNMWVNFASFRLYRQPCFQENMKFAAFFLDLQHYLADILKFDKFVKFCKIALYFPQNFKFHPIR